MRYMYMGGYVYMLSIEREKGWKWRKRKSKNKKYLLREWIRNHGIYPGEIKLLIMRAFSVINL